jgi:hypothetical protein
MHVFWYTESFSFLDHWCLRQYNFLPTFSHIHSWHMCDVVGTYNWIISLMDSNYGFINLYTPSVPYVFCGKFDPFHTAWHFLRVLMITEQLTPYITFNSRNYCTVGTTSTKIGWPTNSQGQADRGVWSDLWILKSLTFPHWIRTL